MNNKIFHLVTVADGKSDADAIREVFQEMLAGVIKSDLMLVNYYDEVPVSYASTVVGVENDSIELAVHEHQALIMKHEKSTLVKSSHFQNGLGVHCYANYVNVPKKTVILNNFAYAQIRAERREAVRVKVREKVPVLFNSEVLSLQGSIIDISGIGVSMMCESLPQLDAGQPGELVFTLCGTTVSVPGSFVRANQQEGNESVCMFQMKPDRRNDSFISQFIYQRQVEIVRELKDGVAAN
jgi:hypothetical protein